MDVKTGRKGRRGVHALCALVVALACYRAGAPGRSGSLDGLTVPLFPRPGLALSLVGKVAEAPAEIVLDLAAPMTWVTGGCYQGRSPRPSALVRIPRVGGGADELPVISLEGIELADRRLAPTRAALVRGERRCAVGLGLDLLVDHALQVDPTARTVALSPSLPRAAYEVDGGNPAEERYVLELTRDPETDRLLLPVRLRQWTSQLAVPMVLGSREPWTVLSASEAQRAGFETSAALAVRVPAARSVAAGLPPFPTFILDAVELAPDLALEQAVAVGDSTWAQPGAAGVLGPGVWGRFFVTIDPRAQVLVLRRPRVEGVPGRQRCLEPDGGSSEESCFSLRESRVGGYLSVVATVWRDLPNGGQVFLELLDGAGAPLRTHCQVGFSFEPAGRGATTQQYLPWGGFTGQIPSCAAEWASVAGAKLALFDEGSAPECPGRCVFAERRGRVACRCGDLLGHGATERQERAVEVLRNLRRTAGPPARSAPPEPEPEPGD